MVTIRPHKLPDMIPVIHICRMTAGELCRKEPIVGERVSNTYSVYYVRECRETSFVLTDENDRPVGYILCEENYKRFKKIFRKIDAPYVFSMHKKDGLLAFALPIPYQIFGSKYPAHLHIDILPEYQGKGYGTLLIETLLKTLKERNVKGVMLTADIENTGAIRFYERLGFKILFKSEISGAIVMGKQVIK